MVKKEFITVCDTATYIDFIFIEKENKYIVYLSGKWKEPNLVFYKEIQSFGKLSDAEEFVEKYQKIVKEHEKHIDRLSMAKMK